MTKEDIPERCVSDQRQLGRGRNGTIWMFPDARRKLSVGHVDRLARRFARDVMCGMLHCAHLSEKLEFGMESAAIISASFINIDNNVVPCRTAIIDLGLGSRDPGLVPNGAPCGHKKVAVGPADRPFLDATALCSLLEIC